MDDPRLRCHEFGFLEVVDLPSEEELKIYYKDRYFQEEKSSYQKYYSDEERAYIFLKIAQRARIAATLRGHHSMPGSFLDVGCGEGFALAWFRERGWSVEGLDHSTAGLDSVNPGMRSSVETGDLFALVEKRITEKRSYDLVWLNNVLEHVASPVTLLKSLGGLIAAEGVLVVTVPNDGSGYQESLLKYGDIPDRFWIAIPDHLAYFDYESLERTTEATGWSCREIIADFPIDFFLLHPRSNYVRDPGSGSAAHNARVRMELFLGNQPHDKITDFYRAMARVGLGRNLTAFLTPK